MKQILIVLILCMATVAGAADKTYYSYPDATSVPDNGRLLMYDPATGSKNVTGSTLRTTPSDTPISSKPITTSPYKRTFESKDSSGNINYYTQANGNVVVVGVLTIGAAAPAPLTVSSIVPASGATGFVGGPITLTFNKNPNSTSASYLYVQGVTTTNTAENNVVTSTAYLAPNTSYTYKVVKASLATLQTDGETTATCGSAMTDVSGVCQSTFTTGYLKIYSVTPAAGSSDIAGTDGAAAFNVVPNLTFGTTKALTAGQYTCSSSYWDGAAWQTDSTPGAFVNTSNIIYTLPSMIFRKSYDDTHLTTYTCSVIKSIGLTTCDAGTTDTGSACTWTFTTSP